MLVQADIVRDFQQSLLQNPEWYKGLTLTERVASLRASLVGSSSESEYDSGRAERRLQRWQEQPPFNHGSLFADRLLMDGISQDELLHLLGETTDDTFDRIPRPPLWLLHLAEAFDEPQNDQLNFTAKQSEKQDTVHLLNTIKPLITYGLKHLRLGMQSLVKEFASLPFDPQSILSLVLPSLIMPVHSSLKRLIALEVNIARVEGRLSGATPEERYSSFIQQLSQKEEMLRLLASYPVLARELVLLLDRWINTNVEFLRRLCADWSDITATFCNGDEPGMLVTINANAGDTHRGGQSVMLLKFSSGFQLVYKPKSLAVDIHFQELLTWLNEQGYQPTFRTIKLLDRGSYGWSEFVAAQSCTSSEEVLRFYERQGSYLALLHVLNATDFHAENIIAAGEHPILIDLETLFHPTPYMPEQESRQSPAVTLLQEGVRRIGLLPARLWSRSDSPQGVDMSGLSDKGEQLTPNPVLLEEQDATDVMRYVRRHVKMSGASNLPRMEEKRVDVSLYRQDIVRGFSKMYRFLMTHREEVQKEVIAKFAHDEIRLVLRSTSFYWHILKESFHPDLLIDALDRDAFFDHLWLNVNRYPYLKQVIVAERDDLWAGDIPMFLTRPDTLDIYSSNGICIPLFLKETGMQAVKRTLEQLSENDLQQQCQLIHLSFASAAKFSEGEIRALPSPQSVALPIEKVTREQLLKTACTIGDRLLELAIQNEEYVEWTGLKSVDEMERTFVFYPTEIDLYDGLPGIALFLGYLGELTQSTCYTTMAQTVLKTLQEKIKQRKGHWMSPGAFSGLGGILYTYSHLGSLWPHLFDEARQLVELLPGFIVRDKLFDISSGSAGAIAGLLSLNHVAPSSRLRDLAWQCGDHLVAHARSFSNSVGWIRHAGEPLSQMPLTGFSHGNAGIAWSLLELAALTGEDIFRQTALAAVAYERDIFSPEYQNWPDRRNFSKYEEQQSEYQQEQQKFATFWCNGAPGIGLGRLGSLKHVDDSIMHDEIEVALQTTLASGFGFNHSLCHGDMGNLDILLVAAQTLKTEQYDEYIYNIAARAIHAIDNHAYVSGNPLGVEVPGLMTGLAGTGYELLRLAEPQKVPSVLLLQPPVL